MARIGFIGLGHMGLPMAHNLIKAGHHVVGFDLQSTACAALATLGGGVGANVIDTANEKDVVITMLQTGSQVAGVTLGPTGIFGAMSKDALFIDCSTIDVVSSRKMHHAAKELGLLSLDAPVSGGVKGAEGATLTFMVGGEEKAFQKGKLILEAMGKKLIHAGSAGSGQAAKICNNMILGISMVAVSEAFALAKSLDLTPEKLHEVVTNASGQCWVMNHYVPVAGVLENVPANHGYAPGFTVAMMLKDLLLSQSLAKEANLDLKLAHCATDLYQKMRDVEGDDLDFSAIVRMVLPSLPLS